MQQIYIPHRPLPVQWHDETIAAGIAMAGTFYYGVSRKPSGVARLVTPISLQMARLFVLAAVIDLPYRCAARSAEMPGI